MTNKMSNPRMNVSLQNFRSQLCAWITDDLIVHTYIYCNKIPGRAGKADQKKTLLNPKGVLRVFGFCFFLFFPRGSSENGAPHRKLTPAGGPKVADHDT